ncbi:Tim44/TimA family putative adaptor protein [Falsiroseomonas selenitidurans]|uniref:Tim44 domain-containing protein n=1 Tax=Falsiroseomonas selenitidurans TaxID=2716335 RepID=A0ABX1EA69_9PROT|nr:Tim44/TimA family putative adaptor protein [Falsiroseomonas selenitidurans]NKC33858.1 Tim44 domain-containing protein [Falsiroseomonas selenitidurans]
MSGGFPVDLILFAMVAAFLVLRLRSVLGRRTGFERPPREAGAPFDPRAKAPQAENDLPELPPAAPANSTRHVVPDARGPVGQALSRIRGVDPAFEPHAFLNGAEGAFRMIVDAFARGDRETLRALLGDETYGGFEGAITAREQAGETQRSEVRAMQEAGIEAADLRGTVADITVRFVSDQINLTTARDGSVSAGAEAVTELTDIWTFQRDLRAADPTWRLVATRSA